ncbi:MAG TPA: response regulator [Gemmatimonadaceae bacterium]|nr:response regulator [Gemmatimonadaceae bacterium]
MNEPWRGAPEDPDAYAETNRELFSSHPVTVLIVEDDARLRAMARRVIGGQGYRVLEAVNGVDAIRVAARQGWRISLVLTDVEMPTIGVRAMLRKLTQLCPAVRTVFMSGYPDDELLARGFDKGHDLFLQKPFTGFELVAMVQQALRVSAA